MLKSFSFCFSPQLLISPSNLKESLARQSILGCRFSPYITLNISCHSLLVCGFSAEKSADSLMVIPLYVICCFSLVAFNSLSLIFVILYIRCLCTSLFVLVLYGILCISWTCDCFLSHIRAVFSGIISSSIFSGLSLVSFWDPYNANISELAVVLKVS